MPEPNKKRGITVEGIVSQRDYQPYIQLADEGKVFAQLSLAQARTYARHIEVMCARAEADAMIWKFFSDRELPAGAANALMNDFRLFRHELDQEVVEVTVETPGNDPPPN